MEFLNDDLDLIDVIENGFPRRIYDRSNYIEDMDNFTFFKRFRLTKPTVLEILPQIEEQIEFEEDRNNAVEPINQLLATLRFYGTGEHLSSVSDFIGIHPSTATRIVKRTSIPLASLRERYIKMPENEQQIVQIQNNFFQIASFPRVVSCVDGTHVRIQSPGGEDGEIFRNRKGFFSINIQIVGDSNLKIEDIVVRWRGSQHDNTMFNHSRIRNRFENGEFQNCVLLGDSGYALRNYLLTPILNPATREEQLCNESHIKTRNTIERLFGVLKRRFPVLAYGLRLKLETSSAVIVATAILHNIAQNMNEAEPPIGDLNMEEINYLIEMGNIPDVPVQHMHDANHAIPFRDEMINYFRNLCLPKEM